MPPQFASPRARPPYPKTDDDFYSRFGKEATCIKHLEKWRWGKGFRCPTCKSTKGWRTADGRLSCAGCRRKISVTAGTILDRQRILVRKWLAAAWLITRRSIPVSAVALSRELKLGYQTARTMLYKLRTAMGRSMQRPLRGPVEVAAIDLGTTRQGVRGPRIRGQLTIAVAIEDPEKRG